MKEFYQLTHPNPLNSRERVWHQTVAFEVSIFGGCIRLANIRSLKPGRGFGTRGLIWLSTLADKHDVFIGGTAAPTGTRDQKGRLNKTALKSWHKRHGFSVGSNGDIRYTPAGRREPFTLTVDDHLLRVVETNEWHRLFKKSERRRHVKGVPLACGGHVGLLVSDTESHARFQLSEAQLDQHDFANLLELIRVEGWRQTMVVLKVEAGRIRIEARRMTERAASPAQTGTISQPASARGLDFRWNLRGSGRLTPPR